MEGTTLRLLWFLLGVSLTRQEMVRLKTSHTIAAECWTQVVLHCNASSSRDGLSVKHMEWFRGAMSLCSVDKDGLVSTHQNHSLSPFHCHFHNDGRLTLKLEWVLPLESGEYKCKLRSNQGMLSERTRVQLQECSRGAKGVPTSDGASCTFSHVHPDGDVHWFQGSHNLSDGPARYQTMKSVDRHGWLTISSTLTLQGELGSREPYNCSLRSSTSGRYIGSTLVSGLRPELFRFPTNAVGSQGPGKTLLYILLSLIIVALN
ncbi:uncharacterized protein LOC133456373 [Cololabis saira]|uniref:uncharacterized protein LOC133456373 n=1 Tax=Cololabis saira TaxID=129043 RepID=UPI002AD4094C|nr:uncharacterized protein LOC133456373 [Cololabis saira]